MFFHKNLQTSTFVIVAFAAIHATAIPVFADVETLHYWRFEEDPGFLEDSVGTATLTPQNFGQVPLPSDGRGDGFSSYFPGIGPNQFAADTPNAIAGLRADDTTTVEDAFTIELFANIDDLSPSNPRSVLVAQASNPFQPGLFGWAFAIEKEGTSGFAYGVPWNAAPRELELFASDGSSIWLIPSGILIDEQTDYFLSASFDIEDDVSFYVKNLSDGSVQTAEIDHSIPDLRPDPVLEIGAPFPFAVVDGLIDEVRFSRGIVPVDDLLVNKAPVPACDLNGDSFCNTTDINDLMSEVAAGANQSTFDLNGDGVVNDADRDEWLAEASIANGFAEPLLVGDGNLDGTVNANDLNALALNWQQEVDDWTAGNFTGAAVNAADLNSLAINWQQSIAAATSVTAPVPEPSAWVLIVVGLALVSRRPRGR